MKNSIKVDQNLLLNDLYSMRNYLMFQSNKRDFKQDLNEFLVLNDSFGKLTGQCFDENEIFNMRPDVIKTIINSDSKSRKLFYKYFMDNINTINTIGDKFNETLYDAGTISILLPEKIRNYNEKDFKDIILDFYSLIDEKYYKIVKKYFDENRISMGEVNKLNDVGGFYTALNSMNTGYIFISKNDLNSTNAKTLVHELGHAIDSELFLNPQQKTLRTLEDTLLELPSSCFENMFCEYLIKNKIDIDGGLMLYNEGVMGTDDYFGQIAECTEKMPPCVDENGNVETEENKKINFRDALIYSIGSYFSYHLSEIYKNSPKEFNKIFYNIISSRKESSLEEMIRKTGINYDDFVNCSIIKDTIDENNQKLVKRFNYNAY